MKRKANKMSYQLPYQLPFQDQLHIDGFEIISCGDVITGEIADELMDSGDTGSIIFNKAKGGDRKRSQTFIKNNKISKSLRRWKRSIENALKHRYPNLIPNDMVVLKSVNGCEKQIAHCDYEQDLDFGMCPDDNIPLGCLICIMEGTTLDVWEKSHRLPCLGPKLTKNIDPRTTIELEVGEMLVFRGDLVHAGSSYQSDNYRVHLFLDSGKVKRYKNRTWFMNKADYISD